jgi:hypothetical protein
MGRTPWKRHFLAICAALVLTVKVVLVLLLLLSKAKRRALKGECINFIFLCFLLWKRKEYFAAAFCYSNSESFPREGRRNHQSITRRQDISTPERECTGGKELRCCHWWEGEQCETSPRPPGSWGVSACYSGVEFLAGRSGRCLTYRAGTTGRRRRSSPPAATALGAPARHQWLMHGGSSLGTRLAPPPRQPSEANHATLLSSSRTPLSLVRLPSNSLLGMSHTRIMLRFEF